MRPPTRLRRGGGVGAAGPRLCVDVGGEALHATPLRLAKFRSRGRLMVVCASVRRTNGCGRATSHWYKLLRCARCCAAHAAARRRCFAPLSMTTRCARCGAPLSMTTRSARCCAAKMLRSARCGAAKMRRGAQHDNAQRTMRRSARCGAALSMTMRCARCGAAKMRRCARCGAAHAAALRSA